MAGAIFRRKAAGIQTYGNTSVSVVSSAGTTHKIKFSRPTPVNVWVKITGLKTDSVFPLDGIDRIKQNIVEYIGSNTRSGMAIGQDVICVTLPTEVLKVPGLLTSTCKSAPTALRSAGRTSRLQPVKRRSLTKAR